MESARFRRVWQVLRPCEATIEWSLDHTGLAAVFGRERLTVNGQVAWWDLAISHGFVVDLPFQLYSPGGLLNAVLQRWIIRGNIVALRLHIDGVDAYSEGDVEEWLSNLRPALPPPAGPGAAHSPDLPLPGGE